MCSSHGDSAAAAGFPHSEIHGSMSAFDYPWHIADRCVLRRLLVPRHSPCTLCSLTCDLSFFTRRKFVDLPFFGSSSFTSCFASLSSLFSFQGTLERINPPDRFRSHGGLKFESHSAFQLMCFSHFRRRSLARSLVGSSGFEPPTSRLSGARSNQLSYEPALVEMNGLEPMTPCLQSRCSPN